MNKKTLLVSALAAAFLAACGGGSKSTNNAESAVSGSSASAASAPSPAASKDLNIYVWSDYVDPTTVADFAKQNNINVKEAYYDSNEVLEAKVLTGNSGYDLVAPSLSNVGRQIKAGAYQKIDKSQIPNYNNIDPELLKLMSQVDEGNQYTVPYFWGINTLAINTEAVKKALGSDTLPENQWDLVFKPEIAEKLKSCGISFFDSPTEQVPLVLKYIGKNPNSEDPADIQAAFDTLKTLHPYVKRYSSSSYIDNLAKGEFCVSIGYGGDLNIAKRRAKEAGGNINIDVLTPNTGVGIWIDSFMIPKDAKNVANAHKYINHTLDPKVAAKNGDFVTYAPASKDARGLMQKEFADNQSIFPSEQVRANSFVVLPKSADTVKLQTKLWQNMKAGK
ncbi:polyamine ABC transporter substrate-binding protein [Alysiella filiformis]|nr:polyamine ABC transporter substrate-binding protein [Alysiella filiformis]QMT32179.1 polyamine ABC transporter substrate-binding protein [Alysiella filiformis]UBQ56898.1 polyamine ABC transporter substrate-binding protein [Alysiella filiformis DSM 16848]